MSLRSNVTTLRTLDGLHLAATLVTPDAVPERAVVLVHGGGVTREEGGFFIRLAAGLGLASLRFDLRGHAESEGRQEDLTLAAILNDIRVALGSVQQITGAQRVRLLGASFAGGVCACYAAKRPGAVDRLVLLNPQLDYKKRTITSRPYWTNDRLNDDMAQELNEQGYIQFTPTLRHGRPILNEVFWFEPLAVLGGIKAPTLVVDGSAVGNKSQLGSVCRRADADFVGKVRALLANADDTDIPALLRLDLADRDAAVEAAHKAFRGEDS